MRKKMLIGLAAALIAVFALSSVALASASVSGPSSVDPGETIQVTISGTGEGVNGTVNASGLEFVSCSSELSAAGKFVLLPDFGTSSVTYTYRVTAQSGQVSVSLTGVTQAVNGEVQNIDGSSWSASVNASEPTQQPTQQPSQQPSQEPSQQPSGEPSTQPSGSASAGASGSVKPGTPGTTTSSKPGASGNQDKMPKTGDATMDLWVLAVVAAGAVGTAVVAGKKVFSR